MNKSELTRLKELAEKATPGPWMAHVFLGPEILTTGAINGKFQVVTENEVIAECNDRNVDCAFIAAANPATILGLIAEIERLEEDFDAAARSAADEFVKAVKLEEEAVWLAQQASLMCDCIENCDECRLFFECGCNGKNSKEIWRKAAREAVEGK